MGLALSGVEWMEQVVESHRDAFACAFDSPEGIHTLMRIMGGMTCALIEELIEVAMDVTGPAPCAWSLVGLGSLAREEMCPFSDLDAVLLIEEATPETLAYFQETMHLLELQTIGLGETPFLCYGRGQISVLKDGFRLDVAALSPVNTITTPEELASRQMEVAEDLLAGEDVDPIGHGLRVGTHMTGHAHVFDAYLDALNSVFSSHLDVLSTIDSLILEWVFHSRARTDAINKIVDAPNLASLIRSASADINENGGGAGGGAGGGGEGGEEGGGEGDHFLSRARRGANQLRAFRAKALIVPKRLLRRKQRKEEARAEQQQQQRRRRRRRRRRQQQQQQQQPQRSEKELDTGEGVGKGKEEVVDLITGSYDGRVSRDHDDEDDDLYSEEEEEGAGHDGDWDGSYYSSSDGLVPAPARAELVPVGDGDGDGDDDDDDDVEVGEDEVMPASVGVDMLSHNLMQDVNEALAGAADGGIEIDPEEAVLPYTLLREYYALDTLKRNNDAGGVFSPYEVPKTGEVFAKDNLCRYIALMLDGLALYFGVRTSSTQGRIRTLVAEGHVHPRVGAGWSEFHTFACRTRYMAHFHHMCEEESIFHPGPGSEDPLLTAEASDYLVSAVDTVLIPLMKMMDVFTTRFGSVNPFASLRHVAEAEWDTALSRLAPVVREAGEWTSTQRVEAWESAGPGAMMGVRGGSIRRVAPELVGSLFEEEGGGGGDGTKRVGAFVFSRLPTNLCALLGVSSLAHLTFGEGSPWVDVVRVAGEGAGEEGSFLMMHADGGRGLGEEVGEEDVRAFSVQVFLALLVNPGPTESQSAFVPPNLVSCPLFGEEDKMMREPDATTQTVFGCLDAKSLLVEWLIGLEQMHWRMKSVVVGEGGEFGLPEGVVFDVFQKIVQVQVSLSGVEDLLSLVQVVEPKVYELYGPARGAHELGSIPPQQESALGVLLSPGQLKRKLKQLITQPVEDALAALNAGNVVPFQDLRAPVFKEQVIGKLSFDLFDFGHQRKIVRALRDVPFRNLTLHRCAVIDDRELRRVLVGSRETLRTLDVTGCHGLVTLGDAGELARNLQILIVSGTQVTDEVLDVVEEGCTSLGVVDVTDAGGVRARWLIEHNPRLILSRLPLRVQYVSRTLVGPRGKNLNSIQLVDCGLGDAEGVVLARVLREAEQVTRVSVAHNVMRGPGVEALVHVYLRVRPSLEVLDVSGNPLDPEVRAVIEGKVARSARSVSRAYARREAYLANGQVQEANDRYPIGGLAFRRRLILRENGVVSGSKMVYGVGEDTQLAETYGPTLFQPYPIEITAVEVLEGKGVVAVGMTVPVGSVAVVYDLAGPVWVPLVTLSGLDSPVDAFVWLESEGYLMGGTRTGMKHVWFLRDVMGVPGSRVVTDDVEEVSDEYGPTTDRLPSEERPAVFWDTRRKDGEVRSAFVDRWSRMRRLEQFYSTGFPVSALVRWPSGRVLAGYYNRELISWQVVPERSELVRLLRSSMGGEGEEEEEEEQVWRGPRVRDWHTGHYGAVKELLVRADGDVVSASLDGTVRVWSRTTGLETLQRRGGVGDIYSMADLGDGRVVVGGQDGRVGIVGISDAVSSRPTADGNGGEEGEEEGEEGEEEGEKSVLLRLGHYAEVTAIKVLSNGRVVTGCAGGGVRVVRVMKGDGRCVLEAGVGVGGGCPVIGFVEKVGQGAGGGFWVVDRVGGLKGVHSAPCE